MELVSVGFIERSAVDNMIFHFFTLSSVHNSELVIVLSDSLFERISKLDICLVLKENRLLVHI